MAASKPFVQIIVEPVSTYRCRFECEHKKDNTIYPIRGVDGTRDSNIQIRIRGARGRFRIFASCVTKDDYRQHPFKLVGDDCEHGFYRRDIENETIVNFNRLGILRVRMNEFVKSLDERRVRRIDPFRHGFDKREFDKNCFRLCFQVYLIQEKEGQTQHFSFQPVVSRPIYDNKPLVISKICCPSSSVFGNESRILLCGEVNKDDIQLRFYQLNDKKDRKIWEQQVTIDDIHKNVAISFKTPKYPFTSDLPLNQSIQCFVQLFRPSDECFSEKLKFEYYYPSQYLSETKRRKKRISSNLNEFFENPSSTYTRQTVYTNPPSLNPFMCDLNRTERSLDNVPQTANITYQNPDMPVYYAPSTSQAADLQPSIANPLPSTRQGFEIISSEVANLSHQIPMQSYADPSTSQTADLQPSTSNPLPSIDQGFGNNSSQIANTNDQILMQSYSDPPTTQTADLQPSTANLLPSTSQECENNSFEAAYIIDQIVMQLNSGPSTSQTGYSQTSTTNPLPSTRQGFADNTTQKTGFNNHIAYMLSPRTFSAKENLGSVDIDIPYDESQASLDDINPTFNGIF